MHHSKIDQEELAHKIAEWLQESPQDNAIWGVTAAVIVAFVVYLQFDAAECYGCNFFYIQILLIFR